MDFQDKQDNKQEMPAGKLEKLESQVRKLLLESRDLAFTEYLRRLTERVRNQVYQIDLLQDELDRSYRAYQQKQEQQSNAAVQNSQEQQSNVEQQSSAVQQSNVASPQKKNAEFTVAAVLLSTLGGIFILTALVMLGMTIVNGFVKGISLYAISLAVLLVSELLVYPRLPRLGSVFSAIAFGGLYLTTLINYEVLNNFNFWVTCGIVFVISMAMLLVSKKRNSAFYRIFGIVSCYISFCCLQWVFTEDKFLALAALYFLINIVCIMLPVEVHKTGINLTHMSCNLFFSLLIVIRPEDYAVSALFLLLFLCASILIMQILFIIQVRNQWKETALGKASDNEGILVVYWLGIVFYSLMLVMGVNGRSRNMGIWLCHGSVLVLAVLCLLSFVALRKGRERWYSYYFLNMAAFSVYLFADSSTEWSFTICILSMLLAAKLLSLTKAPSLRMSEAAITTVACVAMLVLYRKPTGLALCGGILAGVLFMNHWQTYYESVITYTVAFYAALLLKNAGTLYLPAFVGGVFVALLVFNSIKRFRGKNILVFNILALSGQGICYLSLANTGYAKEYLTYFCMLIFGVATFILLFREKYELDFKGKYLCMVVFLSYMILVLRVENPIINSILLMLVALTGVGIGFARRQRGIRIYGLVLSLLVCGKIALYDYWGVPTLQKTFLFLAVGVIALIIAGIYIVLEKKYNTTE